MQVTPFGAEHPQPRQIEEREIDQVMGALDAILLSLPFRTTRQCQELLSYIVKQTLAGQDQTLRERIIGIEVFKRKADYDTSEDPVVRIRAADVRRRLAQFYQGKQQVNTVVRIDIPSGSYRAIFEWQSSSVLPPTSTPLEDSPPATRSEISPFPALHPVPLCDVNLAESGIALPKRNVPSRRWIWIAAFACLIASVGMLQWQFFGREADFRRFWSPMLKGSRPVLICMGSNVAYQLSHEFMTHYLEDRHEQDQSTETFVDLAGDASIPARELQAAKDSFVALGDVAAVSKLVETLTLKDKPYEERFPPDISFAELKDTPTILVGGFNNQLTIALTKDLRFVLSQNSRVIDRNNPLQDWSVRFHGDARDTEDYAVVSRLVDAKSGGPVLVVAGIGQYGTQAAAEFVSSSSKVASLVRNAPRGWANKNMQFVLHVKVIDFRPVATDVVGQFYW